MEKDSDFLTDLNKAKELTAKMWRLRAIYPVDTETRDAWLRTTVRELKVPISVIKELEKDAYCCPLRVALSQGLDPSAPRNCCKIQCDVPGGIFDKWITGNNITDTSAALRMMNEVLQQGGEPPSNVQAKQPDSNESKQPDMIGMSLHTEGNIGDAWNVLRVPGGWLYTKTGGNTVYVPLSNEFQEA